jgi:hypothetical protein
MSALSDQLLAALAIFGVVFVLNVVPAFAPPTWTVLSFIAVRYNVNIVMLSAVGAVAATLGRLALARLSKVIIRQKMLSQGARDNIDHLRDRLQGKTKLTFGVFLLYAFSPFPSNQLFIAYGLTALRLGLVALPFLLGRLVSYTFWGLTASSVARRMAYESIRSGSFFGYYFLATQVFTIATIYLFTRVDWLELLDQRKLGFRK